MVEDLPTLLDFVLTFDILFDIVDGIWEIVIWLLSVVAVVILSFLFFVIIIGLSVIWSFWLVMGAAIVIVSVWDIEFCVDC